MTHAIPATITTNDNKFWLGWLDRLALPVRDGEVICWWQGGDFSLDVICDDCHCVTLLTTSDATLAVGLANRIIFVDAAGSDIVGELFVPRNLVSNSPQYRQLCQQLRQKSGKASYNTQTTGQGPVAVAA